MNTEFEKPMDAFAYNSRKATLRLIVGSERDGKIVYKYLPGETVLVEYDLFDDGLFLETGVSNLDDCEGDLLPLNGDFLARFDYKNPPLSPIEVDSAIDR